MLRAVLPARYRILLLVLGIAPCAAVLVPRTAIAQVNVRDAVVKIHATQRAPDFVRPWTKSRSQESTGSGVVIANNRILTNSHVVQYATRLYVQANQSSQRKSAKVLAVSPEMDLAIITVDDDNFFQDRPALELSTDLPSLKNAVNVYGFPIGGEQMSITEGIISRIEATSFYLEGFGLRIQVDAALNPGNSGGPAVSDDKIVGLVFSGVRDAENIGYLIPAEEIATFLADVDDGHYDGKSRLFDRFQTVENDALRQKLGLQDVQGGMMVTAPFRNDDYPLKEYDVITHVGDVPLDRKGNVRINGELQLSFQYLVPKLAQDGVVPLKILRNGESHDVNVPVSAEREWLIPPLKGTYPPYFIYGPMLFTTPSQDLLARLQGAGQTMLGALESPLFDSRAAKPEFPGQELVILGPRLFSHPTSEGYDNQFFAVVATINDVEIKNLAHLVETLKNCQDDYVTIKLHGNYETMIFRRNEMDMATEEVLEDEGIRSAASDELRKVWSGDDAPSDDQEDDDSP
ncbi:MAG: trypsin-like peptidase domain-containing protein [Pirellulaceae bacterium]|nr:trypsin-like peptidase domain-containing protein [Planctomycetales bacterium]